jgi:hypothetical protein
MSKTTTLREHAPSKNAQNDVEPAFPSAQTIRNILSYSRSMEVKKKGKNVVAITHLN